jgi:hypothetical protein
MSLYEQAARLNNEGVSALLGGDIQTAVAAMTKSIKLMKQELSSNSAEDSKSINSTAGSEQEVRSVEIPDTDSSETIVFNQAILIPSDGEQNEVDTRVYTAAVIFNLALAHHVKASRGDASCMVKAEKLYTMVVLKLVNDDAACRMRIAVVVKLASINNLSQIQVANGDYTHEQVLSQLSNLLRKTNQALFEEPEVQGLLINALLLKQAPRLAPAA